MHIAELKGKQSHQISYILITLVEGEAMEAIYIYIIYICDLCIRKNQLCDTIFVMSFNMEMALCSYYIVPKTSISTQSCE